ncbi:MAG: nucleotidyl transferase AbiEii/AbiGii toxin family protein [Tepidisphaeraceae bacterium]
MQPERFVPVIKALNAAGVDYVVVGGVAVNLLGHVRATVDLDLIVAFEPDNIERLKKALTEAGYMARMPVDPAGLADDRTRAEWQSRNMVVYAFVRTAGPPHLVDVFIQHPIPYPDLKTRSQLSTLGTEPIRICALEDLFTLKRIASRPQDLNDIQQLKAANGSSNT